MYVNFIKPGMSNFIYWWENYDNLNNGDKTDFPYRIVNFTVGKKIQSFNDASPIKILIILFVNPFKDSNKTIVECSVYL